MDEQTRKQTAAKLFTDLESLMAQLWARWQDEQQYEDINDYAKPLTGTVEAVGGKIVKMTKRPFGFHFTLGGATYAVTMSSREYRYKRIA
jgi:hypothetical protein